MSKVIGVLSDSSSNFEYWVDHNLFLPDGVQRKPGELKLPDGTVYKYIGTPEAYRGMEFSLVVKTKSNLDWHPDHIDNIKLRVR